MTTDRVLIFDTTLRDGEQAAGAAMTFDEKIEIAEQLALLKVDIIEAGFAASSPGDFQAVSRIAKQVQGPIIASLARANPDDVDRAAEAVKSAKTPRIHVFISSSDIHLLHQMRRGREEVMDMAVSMVKRAKGYVEDVEFSPMDATRTNPDYLYAMLESTINAGATTVNIPDTVGYAIPEEFANLILGVFENVPNIHRARVSVHCHNDLGLAVANSLAAAKVGARQIEVCINGLGERAGNASLEEVVMSIKTRHDLFGLTTGVDSKQLHNTSRLVSDITGFVIQPNKAIVGINAFRHASGIHQDAVLKERTTFEIMEPTDVGWPSNAIVLGKLSGRAGLRSRLEELGYQLSKQELDQVFQDFKELADKKREVTNLDLEVLMAERRRVISEVITYRLEHLQVSCGDHSIPTATVRLVGPENQVLSDAGTGTGPVDAIYQAINRIIQVPNKLVEYSVKSITEGLDAVGEVTIRIESRGRTYVGRGADTDIIVASARAYMNALNRVLAIQSGEQINSTTTSS
jgi:2-isopropylmalate synthase